MTADLRRLHEAQERALHVRNYYRAAVAQAKSDLAAKREMCAQAEDQYETLARQADEAAAPKLEPT